MPACIQTMLFHKVDKQTRCIFLIYILSKIIWVLIVQHNSAASRSERVPGCTQEIHSHDSLNLLPGTGPRWSHHCLCTNTVIVVWLWQTECILCTLLNPRWRRSASQWKTAAAWLRTPFGSSGCTGASVVRTTPPCRPTGRLVSLPCPAPRIPCAWSSMECPLKSTCL